mgnify:CR=1 FL=1
MSKWVSPSGHVERIFWLKRGLKQFASIAACPKASNKNRIIRPMAATLGTMTNKAVTGVGAPSYTSGVQTWKGAADNLKKSPITSSTNPRIIPGEKLSSERNVEIV